jgi:hypothetical protein
VLVRRVEEVMRQSIRLAAVVVFGLLVGTAPVAQVVGAPPVPERVVTQGAQVSEQSVQTYEVRTSRYSLGDLPLPDLPSKAPGRAHVVAPEGAIGPRPLVLFLHGKHNSCYHPTEHTIGPHWPCQAGERPVPSYRGYTYLQRELAARGYVTVSIAANAVDGQEDLHTSDFGMTARSALVRHHLRAWSRWARGEGAHDEWAGRVDMDSVMLVGHSRGGEGVDRAAIDSRERSPWRIDGQVLLAPSALLDQQAPLVPTVVLLPYCDGDLNQWPGQSYVDLGRDLVPDPALRASVVVMGANHNFFNTEWTPGLSSAPSGDDAGFYGKDHPLCGRQAPSRLNDGAQRAVTTAYVSAAVDLFARGDETKLPLFDGRARRVEGASVLASGLGGHRVMLRPGVDTTVEGAGARLCIGRSDGSAPELCGRDLFWVRTPHWPSVVQAPPLPADPVAPAARFVWSAKGARVALVPRKPVNLSASTHLEARIAVDPAKGAVNLAFRIVDASGESTVVVPQNRGRLTPLPGPTRLLGRVWGQTVRAPLAEITEIDLADVRRVEVVARSDAGRIWVLDTAGWRPGLAPLPAEPVARVDIGDVAIDEGAGGTRTLHVPVRVDGELPKRARVAVQVLDLNGQPPSISVLRLSPGQHTASIEVPYSADRRPDPDREIVVNTWALTGVVTGDRQGQVLIRDDDAR